MARRKSLDDVIDGLDPQIPMGRFVPYDEDRISDVNFDEPIAIEDLAEMVSDDPRDHTLARLKNIWDVFRHGALTLQERDVITWRLLLGAHGATYSIIAEVLRPPVSGPGQVKKIEERAVHKLTQYLSNPTNDLE
jgi:hypothetical protein